jgi:hypothetical protein
MIPPPSSVQIRIISRISGQAVAHSIPTLVQFVATYTLLFQLFSLTLHSKAHYTLNYYFLYMKFSVIFTLLLPFTFFSQEYLGTKKANVVFDISKGATCTPPNHTTIMQTNNVRMMVHTAGNLWQVPTQNNSLYEVPKNSGIMAMFTAALWLGGTDVNGQLKLAALRYRNGQDYWTGPISIGDANTDYDICKQFDKHFITSQDMVREFDSWFEAGQYDQQFGTNTQSANFPNYKIPDIIKNWPAHGDPTKGQDYYLAPFYDRDNDGEYNWDKGDFPWYDIKKTKNCKTDRTVTLYGDENYWWVMNDKGNIHTESGADPIGMEIRAQAFAFATNDEVNNMTFYNYELINRGTQTLYNTYFGFFADGALGDPFDDYVGCDVNRGLGYFYNGDAFDGNNLGFKGYGNTPAAVGVDFFEGPYQDNDGIDNAFGIGTNEALNGIGYGDGIVDNERFGMRRFLYYVNTGGGANPNQTDPISASDYYNYLRGFWKDGTPFYYGGSGHISDSEANTSVPCDFMFPGDTDPQGWGTGGVPQPLWTEQTANNEPYDRRFLQSAGPFILKPGAVNNITVGVVWARAASGGPFASVEVLRRADDKAQALFENCFKVLDAPYAPDLQVLELENQLVLTLSNPTNSNNANEDYIEFDPFIVAENPDADKNYRFQGYMIYQLKDKSVSVSDLEDITKARLVAQCDIADNISRLVNFELDEDLMVSIPTEKVNGENKGIKHSFLVTKDAFAQGDAKLVNFKRYYFMAIAYAHNEYKRYDPNDPTLLDGQKKPFISSRKATIGEVKAVEAIPHNPSPAGGGTIQYVDYGTSPQITRLDGIGNGNRALELTSASIANMLKNGKMDDPTYDYNKGPLNVKVVDPLNLVGGYFTCKFTDYVNPGTDPTVNYFGTDTASWVMYRYDRKGGTLIDSVQSRYTINKQNEQIISNWGISVEITQTRYSRPGSTGTIPLSQEYDRWTPPISSSIHFSDSSKRWLSFINDNDAYFPTNWILSGSNNPQDSECNPDDEIGNPCFYKDELGKDPDQAYEKLLNGGIAPHRLVNYQAKFSPLAYPTGTNGMSSAQITQVRSRSSISRLPNVRVVITNDKSQWTRCAVIELGRETNLNIGGALPGRLRKSPSRDINGNQIAGSVGMSYFPGYAIDLDKGVRLHMAFGENSFMGSDGGADMIWNPSNRLVDNVGNPIMGGQQPIYIFGYQINDPIASGSGCPEYDGVNNWVYDKFASDTPADYRDAYMNLTWVVNPLLAEGQTFRSSTVTMDVLINKEYSEFTGTGANNGRPMYGWSMDEIATTTGSKDRLAESLQLINVVPNPYYAHSAYETSKLDTRVKIINLPENCTISIYNISGKKIRTIKKSNPTTFQDWNLKNEVGIPVASGVYLIHVDVPEVGEVILKAMISQRVPDLEGF